MSVSNHQDGDIGLPLLFTQLVWPSGWVRERACVSIGQLLLDEQCSDATLQYLLRWTRAQPLESLAALGLLALARARVVSSDFNAPPLATLFSSINRPSLLSALFINELVPESEEVFDQSLLHSGEVPPGFAPDPFFAKYARVFLPEIYDMRASELERRALITFRRQWAYEWHRLVDETGVELSEKSLRFWGRGHHERKRISVVDMRLSEVYRSAYLRTVAWAVSTERLPAQLALKLAVETCPVDLALWRLMPGSKPDRFPRAEKSDGAIDTVPEQVWSQTNDLWKRQFDDVNEWVVTQASGIVHEGAAVYDLEIYGAFQKCHGPEAPSADSMADWCHTGVQLSAHFPSPLHFEGVLEEQRDWVKVFGGWSLAPASGSLLGECFPRWQYWRMERRIWLPTPFLGRSRLIFSCTTESVDVSEGREVIAKWHDWTDGLTEFARVDLPPPTGECLVVRKKIIQEFAERTGSSFCWVCRLTAYHRQRDHEEFRQYTDHRVFGGTRILGLK